MTYTNRYTATVITEVASGTDMTLHDLKSLVAACEAADVGGEAIVTARGLKEPAGQVDEYGVGILVVRDLEPIEVGRA